VVRSSVSLTNGPAQAGRMSRLGGLARGGCSHPRCVPGRMAKRMGGQAGLQVSCVATCAIPNMGNAVQQIRVADGREVARQSEGRILRALLRFGWLSTRSLAALCWSPWGEPASGAQPSLAPLVPRASALRMAQRTLCRMRAKRLVIAGQAPDGATIYGLSEAGARELQDAGFDASSAKDLVRNFSSAFYRHRSICNDIAVGALVQGYKVATERETAKGASLAGANGIEGKKPDVLLRADRQVFWVEVERSRKNAQDYRDLLKWLQMVARDAERPGGAQLLGKGLQWGKVVFICTRAFRAKLLRDLEAAGLKKSSAERLLWFETELYVFRDTLFPRSGDGLGGAAVVA